MNSIVPAFWPHTVKNEHVTPISKQDKKLHSKCVISCIFDGTSNGTVTGSNCYAWTMYSMSTNIVNINYVKYPLVLSWRHFYLKKQSSRLNIRYWARSLFLTVLSVCIQESKVICTCWKPEENKSTPHPAFCHPVWTAELNLNRLLLQTVS